MSLQRLLQVGMAVAVMASITTTVGSIPASAHSVPLSLTRTQRAEPLSPIAAAQPGTTREVFGFALASSLGDAALGYPSWNFSLLSTVAFFGLHVNSGGSLVADPGWNVWNSSLLTGLLQTAHAHGTKVVVTLILQDFSPGTPTMCAGLINRATTVAQAATQVRAKGVDGVNVDYEGLNGTCQNGMTSRAMLTDFVRLLRQALPPPSYLSVDTYASSATDSLGFFDVASLNPYVDSFFVMAYDLEYANYRHSPPGCVSFCLGPTAPLTGYFYNDTSTASQYVAAVPASKVILGIPYYGRKSCVSVATPNQYPASDVVADSYVSATGESTATGVATGSYAVHRDSVDPSGHERWDTWINTSMNCTRELYWDDTTSLAAKYDLVNRDGLRGVGIWTLNYGGGAPELWAALATHFSRCASVSVSTSPQSPAGIGTAVTVSAGASGCPNPLFQFWILPPGGVWTIAQGYSTSRTFEWATAGKGTGSYVISVWVRDAASAAPYDAYDSNMRYVLNAIPCSSVTDTATPSPPGQVGSSVVVTAAASGCPNPRYQFWILRPGGTWTVVQAYGSAARYTWNTAGERVGDYLFSVWARDAASTAAYDAFNSTESYRLSVPCGPVTVSASPTSLAAPVGSKVVIAAAASRCPNPRYEFWMLRPGGSWTVAQPYSARATLEWTSTGAAPGRYLFSVWARDADSVGLSGAAPNTYDSFNSSLAYTLTTPCSSVAVSFIPSSSAPSTTQVTVAAAASACPNPRYEFWLLAPGGAWTVVQPYGTNPTFAWNTANRAPGAYLFSVWARDASSPGTSGSGSATYDAYNSTAHYTLTSPPCTAVSTSVSPASPAPVGSTVNITAIATGCSSPVYEFWLLPPGGVWTLVQTYSPKSSYTWATAGKPKGVYLIAVWARDAASSGVNGAGTFRYDSYNSSGTYTLK